MGQILRIDTANNDLKVIGSKIYDGEEGPGWGRPVIGDDKCIYFPPSYHDRVLKYNPITNNISLIDCSYGFEEDKWMSSVLSSDGYIYILHSS